MKESKHTLIETLTYEKRLYFANRSACMRAFLLKSKFYRIWQYQKTLRIAEYHQNSHGFIHKLAFACMHRRKYRLGIRLGFEIPENCFGKGLMIYHIAPIVVNEDARIGEECRLTGNCCIGNTGADTASPRLGKGVMLGWGCCIIGDIKVADGAVIGAGCVVTRSVSEKDAHVAGVPGRILKSGS